MNRINRLFNEKHSDILSVYFTAGYPVLDSVTTIIKSLADAGADMIEIGIPFSDPMADGPVIQKSDDVALRNGMNLSLLFQQLRSIRAEVSVPLLLMGYLNPVMQFGMENFCRKCAETGIDGVILPDLPLDIFLEDYQPVFKEHHLHNIFLISPQTLDPRIRLIDNVSEGFIYMVSASSTTGVKDSFTPGQIAYFERIRDMKLKNPCLIGFGIASRETFSVACQYSNGAIIGSAFVKMLEGGENLPARIHAFCKTIKAS